MGTHLLRPIVVFIAFAIMTYAGVAAYAISHLVIDRSHKRSRHD
jgi:phage shock protein PspC (stress-responsive transcriptional regulator)